MNKIENIFPGREFVSYRLRPQAKIPPIRATINKGKSKFIISHFLRSALSKVLFIRYKSRLRPRNCIHPSSSHNQFTQFLTPPAIGIAEKQAWNCLLW